MKKTLWLWRELLAGANNKSLLPSSNVVNTGPDDGADGARVRRHNAAHEAGARRHGAGGGGGPLKNTLCLGRRRGKATREAGSRSGVDAANQLLTRPLGESAIGALPNATLVRCERRFSGGGGHEEEGLFFEELRLHVVVVLVR